MRFLFLGLLLIPSVVFAKITVIKLNLAKAVISFDTEDHVEVGDNLKIGDGDDTKVFATVKRVVKNRAIISFPAEMPISVGIDLLHVEQKNSTSSLMISSDSDKSEPSLKDISFHWGLGVAYVPQTTLTFNSMAISGSSSSLSSIMTLGPGTSILLDFRKLPQNSWGSMGFISYDSAIAVTGGSITNNGVSTALSTTNPAQIQVIALTGMAAYRWNAVYLSLGLNYSSPTYITPSGSTGSITAQGGVGGQLGLGFYLTDRMPIEIFDRALSISVAQSTGSTTVNWGSSYMQGYGVSIKYLF